MIKKILSIFFFSIITLTMLIVLNEYFKFHQDYLDYILSFQYFHLILIIFLEFIVFTKFVSKPNWNTLTFNSVKIKGWNIFLLLLTISLTIFIAYATKVGLFGNYSSLSGLLTYNIKLISLSFWLCTMVLFNYLLGNQFLKQIKSEEFIEINFLHSIASGIILNVLILFILGSVGLLIPNVLWPIILIFISFKYKEVLEIIKTVLFKDIVNYKKLGFKEIFLFTILLSTLCINLSNLIRPVPIGWDDRTYYMNIPKLLSESGSLISGGMSYNWSLFMSQGFTLFKSPEIAMGLSFIGGVFALIALYKLSKKFLSSTGALTVVTLFYTLPAIVFQSSRDMKTDMALLFFLVTILLGLLNWSKDKLSDLNSYKTIAFLGVLTGFALGLKYTSIIFIISSLIFLAHHYLKTKGMVLMTSLAMIGILIFKVYSFTGIDFDNQARYVGSLIMLMTAIISVVMILKQKDYLPQTKEFIKTSGIYLISAFIVFSPWIVKNSIETKSLSLESILYGETETVDFNIKSINAQYKEDYKLKNEANTNDELKAELDFESNWREEEVTRYIGYEEGFIRTLTIPYDVIVNSNVNGRFVQLGFLLILTLPIQLLLLARSKSRKKSLILAILFLTYILIAIISSSKLFLCNSGVDPSCISQSVNKYMLETSGVSFINSITQLLISPITYLYFMLSKLSDLWVFIFLGLGSTILLILEKYKNIVIKNSLTVFTLCYLLIWLLIGGGIFWYGILGFAILLILLLKTKDYKSDEKASHYIQKLLNITILFWITLAFMIRITFNLVDNPFIYDQLFAGYMIGAQTQEEILQQNIPLDVINKINEDETAKIYRIGTSLPYFIKKNNERIFNDNQMTIFKKLYNKSNTREEVTEKMKLGGFKYLIIDLSTATIDNTADKTLTQKYYALADFMTGNKNLVLLATDRVEEDGKLINPGRVAVFEIK